MVVLRKLAGCWISIETATGSKTSTRDRLGIVNLAQGKRSKGDGSLDSQLHTVGKETKDEEAPSEPP
jgi:hypothetical protein